MDAAGWISMIQVIPAEYQDRLSLLLNSGIELNIQAIIRLESQFIACRGRMMGSTETGLTFFVPYDQINCLSYTKTLKEDVVLGWFTEPAEHANSASMPAAEISDTITEPAAEAAPEGESAPVQPAAASGQPKPVPPRPLLRPAAAPPRPAPSGVPLMPGAALPAKAAMIERLRKRAQGGTGSAQGTTPKPPPEQK